jgi:hypothetical protein
MVENGSVPLDQLLITPLPFSGKMKCSIVLPAINIAVLFTNVGIAE